MSSRGKERRECLCGGELFHDGGGKWSCYNDDCNANQIEVTQKVRQFQSGATRDTDEGKLDFEGFLSPAVLIRYAEYMHKNRKQSDGELRASDNWQKGMPVEEYRKSLLRHVVDVWCCGRG